MAEKAISKKPVLSFGILSILGQRIACTNDNENVADRQDEVEDALTLNSPQGNSFNGSAKAEMSMTSPSDRLDEDQAQDMELFTSSMTGSAVTRIEEVKSFNSEHSSLPVTTFPLMPCISPHTLLLKPLDRYRQKGLVSEYRRVGHPYSNRTPAKRKKPRTTFSRDQIAELEARFIGQKYLASAERLRLANHLQLTDAQVKTWFQNRRTKWRRQTAEEREAERNAATKYIMKMQESAAAAAAFWSPLLNMNCRADAAQNLIAGNNS